MSNYVAAIDIGTTKIITLVGEKTSVGVKIIGYSEAPSNGVMRGEVVNIQKVLDSLIPTLEEIREQLDEFQIEEVFVGIAGQNIRCDAYPIKKHRPNSSSLISKAEIASMLEEAYISRVSPGEQVLHVIPQSYNVDEHMGLTDPVGMDGKEVDGNYRLFIGKINSTTHSQSVINRAGLTLKQLILEPIASARAILTEDEMELGVAMVDIGGGTTDLLIYHDNIIRHTAVIPFGGNSITEDIRQVCGVSLKHAEALKKQHGSCISEYAPESKSIAIKGQGGSVTKEIPYKLLSSAIEARVSEIIATVLYEIEKSGYKNSLIAGIVLTGGTSNLIHIPNLIKQITGYKVRTAIADLPEILTTSRKEIYKASASTAVGLILKGFEYLEDNPSGTQTYNQNNLDKDLFGNPISQNSKKALDKNKPSTPKRGIKERFGGLLDDMFSTPSDNEA